MDNTILLLAIINGGTKLEKYSANYGNRNFSPKWTWSRWNKQC